MPVSTLFSGQAALVHFVRGIQQLVGQLQELMIMTYAVQVSKGFAQIPGQRRDGTHILGHGAHAESARPGLQAGEDIDKACKHSTHTSAYGGTDTVFALCQLMKASAGGEGIVA